MNNSIKEINTDEKELERLEQIERGKRLERVREEILQLKKAPLGKLLGVSGQYVGKVESGKANYTIKSIKRLRNKSNKSADYLLFGIDDTLIEETRELLEEYTDLEIINGIEFIKKFALFIKYHKK